MQHNCSSTLWCFFLHICTAGHVFLMHSYDAGYGKFENKPSLFVRLVVIHPPRNIHLKLRSGVKIFRSERDHQVLPTIKSQLIFLNLQPDIDMGTSQRDDLCNFSRVILKRKGVWVWVCSYMTSHFIPAGGGVTFEPQSLFSILVFCSIKNLSSFLKEKMPPLGYFGQQEGKTFGTHWVENACIFSWE